jgi:glycosyltransferase involved in cell wall biosynthesis
LALAGDESAEIWVIDDGSVRGDEIRAALAQMADGPAVRLHRFNSNRGVAAARNEGFARSEGEVVIFVDADDEVESGFVGALARKLQEGCDVAACSMLLREGDRHRELPASAPGSRALLLNNSMGAGIGLRKNSPIVQKIWQSGGLYNPAQRFHYEDWELNLLLSLLDARFGVVSEPLYIYYVSPGGRNSRRPDHLLRSSLDVALNALRRLDRIDPTRTREAGLLALEMLSERVMRDFSAPPPAPAAPWWRRFLQ